MSLRESFTNDCKSPQTAIASFQHAFRKIHGGGHQLPLLSETVFNNLNWGFWITRLLLYAQQAFNRVWHDGLLFQLIQNDNSRYLIERLLPFLSGRKFPTIFFFYLHSQRFDPWLYVYDDLLGTCNHILFIRHSTVSASSPEKGTTSEGFVSTKRNQKQSASRKDLADWKSLPRWGSIYNHSIVKTPLNTLASSSIRVS